MLRVLSALLLAGSLAAQAPPLVTDRPDQTESAAVVPVGAVQIEAGMVAERLASGVGRLDGITIAGTLLRFGVLPRLELRLGFDGWRRERLEGTGPIAVTSDGVGDMEAGFKVSLLPAESKIALAVLAGASLPVGSALFSSGVVEPAGRLALAVPLTERLGVGVNAGAFREAGRTDGLYSAVLGLGLTPRVALFAESFGTVSLSSGGGAAHAVDGGLTVLLAPTLQLDASGGVGLNDAAAEWFVGVGVSARIGR